MFTSSDGVGLSDVSDAVAEFAGPLGKVVKIAQKALDVFQRAGRLSEEQAMLACLMKSCRYQVQRCGDLSETELEPFRLQLQRAADLVLELEAKDGWSLPVIADAGHATKCSDMVTQLHGALQYLASAAAVARLGPAPTATKEPMPSSQHAP